MFINPIKFYWLAKINKYLVWVEYIFFHPVVPVIIMEAVSCVNFYDRCADNVCRPHAWQGKLLHGASTGYNLLHRRRPSRQLLV